ncbi:hypothetical protein VM1G_04671 [Cytospora mali]|uniref:SnoaL-like domain-containing protein n=1 Tax=Cytospora mali TaxID=578113 RepID=A0A194VZ18_CYTMA|nr:hypothetical protein VM1G_04671 [Valsa mali]
MSKRRETAIEVIESYRAWDIERIMAYRTDDCVQLISPSSSNPTPTNDNTSSTSRHRPERGNAEYREYFSSVMPAFQDFQPEIHELVEDERENKVIMWASSKGQTLIGPYGNEYMLLLYFNETGDKVKKIVEFVDSGFAKEYFPRLGAHMAKLA